MSNHVNACWHNSLRCVVNLARAVCCVASSFAYAMAIKAALQPTRFVGCSLVKVMQRSCLRFYKYKLMEAVGSR